MSGESVECGEHGTRDGAFVCRHMVTGTGLGFHWGEDPDDPFDRTPDAWCDECETVWQEEGEWNSRSESFSDIKLICDECYVAARARNWPEESYEGRKATEACLRELQLKQTALRNNYRLDEWERWDWSRDHSHLVFSHEGAARVVADILFVGSYSTNSGSWMWSWANRNFSDAERRPMLLVRERGAELGLMKVATGYWYSETDDGWEMTAHAVDVLDAIGSYRTPSDSGHHYMIITDIRWS